MEAERITLNQRERDRLRVLNEIRQRHITQMEAAQRLKTGRGGGSADTLHSPITLGNSIFLGCLRDAAFLHCG